MNGSQNGIRATLQTAMQLKANMSIIPVNMCSTCLNKQTNKHNPLSQIYTLIILFHYSVLVVLVRAIIRMRSAVPSRSIFRYCR